ncbi:MAG: dihydrodipicolinate synthase family protein [Tepidanaerobacteraceae bacterium]|nr:dihydrodipicolinate synthase family protein [Tepidanaerobacteraceae bacterium]
MKKKRELKGMIPAIVTPLNEERKLDKESYKKIIDNAMNHNCTGVMILGTIGEGTDVDRNTYFEAIKSSVEIMNGRGLVVTATSSSLYENIIENINIAADAGADVVLNVTPFYHKLSQEVIYDFYMHLADDSKLPVMIYDMPDVTKNNVDINTIAKLSTHENIVGIKDSSGNITYFQQLVCNFKSDKFSVFMGRAPLALCALFLGASGTMTPMSNLNPELEASLYKFLKEGEIELAKKNIMKIQEIVRLYASIPNPISSAVKGIMSKKDYVKNMQQVLFQQCLIKYFRPSLTTVHVPKEELGRFAVKLLIDKINDGHEISTLVKLPFKLIVRESCDVCKNE